MYDFDNKRKEKKEHHILKLCGTTINTNRRTYKAIKTSDQPHIFKWLYVPSLHSIGLFKEKLKSITFKYSEDFKANRFIFYENRSRQ